MRKMKHREGKRLAPNHTAIKFKTQYTWTQAVWSESLQDTISKHEIDGLQRVSISTAKAKSSITATPSLSLLAGTGRHCQDFSEKSVGSDASGLLYPRGNQIVSTSFYAPGGLAPNPPGITSKLLENSINCRKINNLWSATFPQT